MRITVSKPSCRKHIFECKKTRAIYFKFKGTVYVNF